MQIANAQARANHKLEQFGNRRELEGCKVAPTEPHFNKVAYDSKAVIEATMFCSLCQKHCSPKFHKSKLDLSYAVTDDKMHLWNVEKPGTNIANL